MNDSSDRPPSAESWKELRRQLLGMGSQSVHKHHYATLRQRMAELERFRRALDAANDLLFLIELPGGRILQANRSAAERLGFQPGDLAGIAFAELLEPGHWDELAEAAARRSDTPFSETLLGAGDIRIPVEIALRRADDSSDGVLAARDITERLHTEQELRRSAERLQLALESTQDALYDWRPQSGELYLSPRYYGMLGFAAGEIPPTLEAAVALIHPDDLPRVKSMFDAHLAGELDSHSAEWRMRTRQGEWLWILGRGRVTQRDEAGKALRIIGTHTDITQRCLAQEALERKTQELATLIGNVPGSVYRCEVNAPWRILTVSEGIRDICGYEPADFIGGPLPNYAAIVHPEDLAMVDRTVMEAVAENRTYTIEYRIRHADGSLRWVFERGRAIRNAAGEPAWLEGVFIDITDRKAGEEERERLRDQLLQAQKMEAVGRLAGGIAHDFNNLLTVIHGYAELAARQLDPESRLHSHVREIAQASERAGELTRQLLAFSRKQVLQPQVLDLNALVTANEGVLRRLIGEDIEFRCDLEPHLQPLKADPTQIHLALLNLVVNARDAMPEGGKLTIETSQAAPEPVLAQFPGAQPVPHVTLSVIDTGCGMDEETRRHAFEPFFTTKPVGRGTGLGLATVYGIVSQSGGHISLDSEPGRGSRFVMYFPAAAGAAAPAPTREAARGPRTGSETVLLVEDQNEVRGFASESLKGSGYRVLCASCGEEALRVARQVNEPIHALVSDVVMPGMSGPELSRELTRQRPGLRTLFVSGYADRERALASLPAGSAFLQKPFGPAELASRLRELLDRHGV